MKKRTVDDILKEVASFFETQDYDYYMPEAIQSLHKVAEIEPDNPEIYYWLGKCSANGMGEIDEGLKWFRKAVELKPNFTNALLEIAALNRDHPSLASVETYQQIIKIDPGCLEAWSAMIGMLKYLKMPEDVEKAVEQLVAQNPEVAGAWMVAGDAFVAHYVFETSDDLRALSFFDRAIQLEPQNENHYYQRYFALFRLGRLEEALCDLEMQRKLGTQTVLNNYFVEVYKSLGRFEDALRECNSSHFEPYLKLAYRAQVYEAMGDYARALKEIKAALSRVPRYDPGWKARLHQQMAEIHNLLGDTDLALESIEKAKKLAEFPMVELEFSLWKARFLKESNPVEMEKLLTKLEKQFSAEIKSFPPYLKWVEELRGN
ncbi:MAG: tetratricopeptide repeat protein [Bacteroidia bacterium]|nr:tetratricopeptide repeat protein [Bacteroidia bacterium]